MNKWNWNLSIGVLLISFFPASPIRAQQQSIDELKKEIQVLSETVKAMQKDLQEIKGLLQSRVAVPPTDRVVLDIGHNPVRGQPDAKVMLIEFSDYQCPFCGRHVRETAPQLNKEYIETGKVKHVFMNLPLESLHKLAFKAAEACYCAGEQGRYWEMHDRLYANQQALESLETHAEAIGIDAPKFQECLNSGKEAMQIRRDMAEGQKAGVTATPTFFLAMTGPDSKIRTVARITGAQPFATFKAAIDKLLGEQK